MRTFLAILLGLPVCALAQATTTVTGLSGSILNNGSLIFGGATSDVFAGIIGGTGTVTKTGTGTMTMNGAQALTGLTSVAQGTLVMNGGTAGGVDVAAGATLRANGFIAGSLTLRGSLIAAPAGVPFSVTTPQSTDAGVSGLTGAPVLTVGNNFIALNGSRVGFDVGPGSNPTMLVGASASPNGAHFDITAPSIAISEIHDSRKVRTYTLEGLVGIRHARISRSSFAESGAVSISLDGADETLNLTQTDVKAHLWCRDGTYRPFADFSYRRELAEDGTQAAVRFDGLPTSDFIVEGINIPANSYSLRGGLTIALPFGQATTTDEYKRAQGQWRQIVGFRMRFK